MKPQYRRRHKEYTPVKTVPAKSKKRKSNKHSFEAKQQPTNVVIEGVKTERLVVLCKLALAAIMIMAGLVLAIMDIRDDGMTFEGMGINYSGSLSGILLALVGGVIVFTSYPKIKLE